MENKLEKLKTILEKKDTHIVIDVYEINKNDGDKKSKKTQRLISSEKDIVITRARTIAQAYDYIFIVYSVVNSFNEKGELTSSVEEEIISLNSNELLNNLKIKISDKLECTETIYYFYDEESGLDYRRLNWDDWGVLDSWRGSWIPVDHETASALEDKHFT